MMMIGSVALDYKDMTTQKLEHFTKNQMESQHEHNKILHMDNMNTHRTTTTTFIDNLMLDITIICDYFPSGTFYSNE